ncbi:hypothetical protein FZC79_13570 [Rossellomorea vietnamensis]|uniref:Uncharacterized protein n=1 Tax=Rossellomorea vietnamensis TaxID=218284 RepID=A0A5D4KBE6_9BACI|nr:hypothetical protein [Rossellomorea vietnamensis]TYR74502.1 hypothetical protein FZC79_13570 [Rossellomorea vietnamensis]
MNILKRVNDILFIIVIGLFLSYFLMENKIPIYLVLGLLSITYLLTAVEFIKGRQDKGGYKYIVGAIAMLFAAAAFYIR